MHNAVVAGAAVGVKVVPPELLTSAFGDPEGLWVSILGAKVLEAIPVMGLTILGEPVRLGLSAYR